MATAARRRESEPEVAYLWQQACQRLRECVDATKFTTWLEPLQPLPSVGTTLRLAAPNAFIRDGVLERYAALIEETLRQLTGTAYQVALVVHEAPEAPRHREAGPSPLTRSAPLGGAVFNPRFTFDTFVVGASNQFAHAACLAVARHPARTYNPLFIYGDVGLGKTHLLHAIGHYVQQAHPHLVACYVSSEKFLNDLVVALSHDKMDEFRARYRKNDLVLVDDIQFLIGKERTQEEFFHTFNVLYNANKQIVITSDKLPKDMVGLEKRLRSRFEWGLIADLQPPDLETKIAILKKKAEYMQMRLPDEVAWFIARRTRGDVRKLEGALNVLEAYTAMTGQELSVSLAQSLLGNLTEAPERTVTIADIERVVADHYKIKSALLRSKKRNKEIAHARHVAMYLARVLTNASLPQIGKNFGDRDHTSVLHACNKIKSLLEENWEFKEEIEQLMRALQS
ncbi:MAG: chromosomal replication initiator protein DnaA [Candidatus Tectimicrobiota bacterium]|nr:MAG: chromosomal replication initiator protein DnaA [Candidatus Tectomicrobia bacterium]